MKYLQNILDTNKHQANLLSKVNDEKLKGLYIFDIIAFSEGETNSPRENFRNGVKILKSYIELAKKKYTSEEEIMYHALVDFYTPRKRTSRYNHTPPKESNFATHWYYKEVRGLVRKLANTGVKGLDTYIQFREYWYQLQEKKD